MGNNCQNSTTLMLNDLSHSPALGKKVEPPTSNPCRVENNSFMSRDLLNKSFDCSDGISANITELEHSNETDVDLLSLYSDQLFDSLRTSNTVNESKLPSIYVSREAWNPFFNTFVDDEKTNFNDVPKSTFDEIHKSSFHNVPKRSFSDDPKIYFEDVHRMSFDDVPKTSFDGVPKTSFNDVPKSSFNVLEKTPFDEVTNSNLADSNSESKFYPQYDNLINCTGEEYLHFPTNEKSYSMPYNSLFMENDAVYYQKPNKYKNNTNNCLCTSERMPNEDDIGDNDYDSISGSLVSTKTASSRGRKKYMNSVQPIPSRFQVISSNSSVRITLLESNVQCLSVLVDYHGYKGTLIGDPEIHTSMINNAVTSHIQEHSQVKPIELYNYGLTSTSSPLSTLQQRVRYTRNINDIKDAITNILYKESSVFCVSNPYEPQFFRFELNDHGDLINESKCGLCPYCETVKFLPFKNSSYLSHLTLEHGIFSNNYLTPEGIYHGKYLLSKKSLDFSEQSSSSHEALNWDSLRRRNQHKPRATEALACPACLEVIEVGCWKKKANPLLSYFRHFKKHHKDLTNQPTRFQTNAQINISKRGRKLHVYD